VHWVAIQVTKSQLAMCFLAYCVLLPWQQRQEKLAFCLAADRYISRALAAPQPLPPFPAPLSIITPPPQKNMLLARPAVPPPRCHHT
jgi:hypothetical protein